MVSQLIICNGIFVYIARFMFSTRLHDYTSLLLGNSYNMQMMLMYVLFFSITNSKHSSGITYKLAHRK